MNWHEIPMTWADGVRLLLAYTLIDFVSSVGFLLRTLN